MTSHHSAAVRAQLAVLAACVLSPLAVRASQRFEAFQANWAKAGEALDAGDFAQAAVFYEKTFEFIPFEPESRVLYAGCLARLGKKDEAFAELNKAAEYGWTGDMAPERQPDFANLEADPRMAAVRKAAAAAAGENVVLYAGKTVRPSEPAPLLVLLHGLGEVPRVQVPYWKDLADQRALVIAAPRGPTTIPGRNGHLWSNASSRKAGDIDVTNAASTVDAAIELAARSHAIDRSRIILAGFSQGGGAALRLLAADPGRYPKVLAFCPTYESPASAPIRSAAGSRAPRAYIIAGELDKHLPAAQKAGADLRAAGAEVTLLALPDAGHEYPVDWVATQLKALDQLLQP